MCNLSFPRSLCPRKRVAGIHFFNNRLACRRAGLLRPNNFSPAYSNRTRSGIPKINFLTKAEIICNAVDIQDGKKDFVVLTMEKPGEQRAEQRLRYRWPVHFARDVKEKPSPGQIVDVSSRGLAILCHADKNCPHPDQLVTVDFGVPHFDLADSFDAVFFNRIGRVCRVDNLSNLVNRVAVQFAEPLFFKPGEQNISESDAQQRLEAKAHSISKAEEIAKAQTQARAEAQAKAESQAKARAEAERKARAETEARIQIQKKAKSDVEKNAKAHAETLVRAEERIKAYAQAKAEAEEKLKAEIEARCKAEANSIAQAEKTAKAEAKAKAQVMLRAKAEKKAKSEARKRAKLEAQTQQKIKSYTDQLTKIKAEATEAIAWTKAEAEYTVAKVKAEFKEKTDAYDKAKIETSKKPNAKTKAKKKAKQPTKETLLKTVDKFITDRDRIY